MYLLRLVPKLSHIALLHHLFNLFVRMLGSEASLSRRIAMCVFGDCPLLKSLLVGVVRMPFLCGMMPIVTATVVVLRKWLTAEKVHLLKNRSKTHKTYLLCTFPK